MTRSYRRRSRFPQLRALVVCLAIAPLGCRGEGSPAGGEHESPARQSGTRTILNVSYDPTRELYREFNAAFARHWQETTGQRVTIQQSHGGSGSQSRAVIDGLQADVVTLALAFDVEAIARHGRLLPTDWQSQLPRNSAPYVSTLAFLVRRGNPKNLRTWEDLIREDVQVITPNPKTSGVARWNYLALWGAALRRELGDDWLAVLHDPERSSEVEAAHRQARQFVQAVFRNVPLLDRAARGATNTFVQRRIGDVLINWENEALLGAGDRQAGEFELVTPPSSILAEPVVAIVEVNATRRGTREVARAYLEYLYSEVGQDIAGKNFYRPTVCPKAQAKYADQFPALELYTIEEVFGGWEEAHRIHFSEGGTFDQIYRPGG